MIKFRILFFLSSLILFSCLDSKKLEDTIKDRQEIKISGSSTMSSFINEISDSFVMFNDNYKFKITTNGSNSGIKDLVNKNSDIAMSSNKITDSISNDLHLKKIAFKEVFIAYDAISFLVQPSINVSQLTHNQLQDILRGKITNWKEVGGKDMNINIYTRENNSGTFSFLESHIDLKTNYHNMKKYSSQDELLEAMMQDQSAIGYSSMHNVSNFKKIDISFNNEGKFISPSVENIYNYKYQLVRGLYLYYLSSNEEKVKTFIEYIQNGGGIYQIKKHGFIPKNNSDLDIHLK